MIENNNLSSEVGDTSCWLVLWIRGYISSLNVLNRHVLDIKSNVISWGSFWERLVVHLHRLNLSGQLVGGKGDNHAGLNNSSLDTTNGDCSPCALPPHGLVYLP